MELRKTSAKRLVCLLLVICTLLSFTSVAFAGAPLKNVCIKKEGKVFPDIIGLGAKDIITFDINGKSKIVDINVRQEGGSCLGIINVTPKGYEIKASTNTIYTYWKLNISAPVKIFYLSKTLKEKCIEYKLSNDGSVKMRIVYTK